MPCGYDFPPPGPNQPPSQISNSLYEVISKLSIAHEQISAVVQRLIRPPAKAVAAVSQRVNSPAYRNSPLTAALRCVPILFERRLLVIPRQGVDVATSLFWHSGSSQPRAGTLYTHSRNSRTHRHSIRPTRAPLFRPVRRAKRFGPIVFDPIRGK